jgi:large subunit ribosomal protein L15
MKAHELKVAAKPNRKRVGRGISAGQGKTAGRGTKGQNSRSGGGVRLGFEGGQNPLAKRLPKKRGFQSLNRTEYQVVNLERLQGWKATHNVTAAALAEAGLVKFAAKPVKILSDGSGVKLKFQVQAISQAAKSKIEQAGGTIELVPIQVKNKPRERSSSKSKADKKTK